MVLTNIEKLVASGDARAPIVGRVKLLAIEPAQLPIPSSELVEDAQGR